MSTLMLRAESESLPTQALWGTVEFWTQESGFPEWLVRERLELHHPRLMLMQQGDSNYVTDVYSEGAFLEACDDLLVAQIRAKGDLSGAHIITRAEPSGDDE
jgi:hypothetical protein